MAAVVGLDERLILAEWVTHRRGCALEKDIYQCIFAAALVFAYFSAVGAVESGDEFLKKEEDLVRVGLPGATGATHNELQFRHPDFEAQAVLLVDIGDGWVVHRKCCDAEATSSLDHGLQVYPEGRCKKN